MSRKQKDLQWENRVLCSDESCIGVIGPDGRCKECGLAYEGELPETFNLASSNVSVESQTTKDEIAATSESIQDGVQDEASVGDADDEWARRRLCIDDSCIGVVGPDGCCKECGKPYPQS